MNDLKPSAIATLVGGALVVLGSILDWGPSSGGLSTDTAGLQGIMLLVGGGAVIALAAMKAFGGNDLQFKVGALDKRDVVMLVGILAFFIGFGWQFRSGSQIGVTLLWLGGAAIVAGTFLEGKEGDTPSASSGPAQPF